MVEDGNKRHDGVRHSPRCQLVGYKIRSSKPVGNIMVASSILNVVNGLVFINPFATLTEHSKLFYTTCCIHPHIHTVLCSTYSPKNASGAI